MLRPLSLLGIGKVGFELGFAYTKSIKEGHNVVLKKGSFGVNFAYFYGKILEWILRE